MNELTSDLVEYWRAGPTIDKDRKVTPIFAVRGRRTVTLATIVATFEWPLTLAKKEVWEKYTKCPFKAERIISSLSSTHWVELFGFDLPGAVEIEEAEPTKKELRTKGWDSTVFSTAKGNRFYMRNHYYEMVRKIVSYPTFQIFLYSKDHPLQPKPSELAPFLIYEDERLVGTVANCLL